MYSLLLLDYSDAAASSSKAGLSPQWLKAAAAAAAANDNPSPPTSPVLGGLNDADLISTRPQPAVVKKSAACKPGVQLLSRKHEVHIRLRYLYL